NGGGGGTRAGRGGAALPPDQLIFMAWVDEMGPRLAPNAKVYAKLLLAGTAGNTPAYVNHLLVTAADGALPVLIDGLKSKDISTRERAINALASMGGAAAPAKDALEAAKATADPRELPFINAALKRI